jgi:fluoride exporter
VTAPVWIGVAALGGVGALARFVVDAAVSARLARDFPFGTLAVNLSGALALGLLTGAGVRGSAAVLEGGAVVGAYTTFSTWMLESHRLAEEGDLLGAFLNLSLSLTVGLAAAALGRHLGGWL